MINLDQFTLIVLIFIIAPIVGAIALLILFFFEKQLDLLRMQTRQIELEKEFQKSLYVQLSQQIQPHFMFNTLNVILSLARLRRTEQVVGALEVFSKFLKFKYNTDEPMIRLEEEIRYTGHYLEIQHLRFGERLRLVTDYDENVLDAYIPPFVLQTIVENAFKHGLESKMGPVELTIRCLRSQKQVLLTVIDNGVGLKPISSDEMIQGHGLENIRKRLHIFFGEESSLSLSAGTQGGAVVEVRWPYTQEEILKAH
ncbi:sensor histidine kinase [Paenibacillus xylanexedens]|uniref:Sensor histidine kinase YesM n=1 Tax=Paenibacillus xylanexedens TaxID=528191 RepID=A0ABS4RNH8_PAEXY|nr:histidine kinase [Paenibacillus xylanexedens]MBP2244452.1 sensor histidine kinase YesM [Paenibacillus xylanexedens]